MKNLSAHSQWYETPSYGHHYWCRQSPAPLSTTVCLAGGIRLLRYGQNKHEKFANTWIVYIYIYTETFFQLYYYFEFYFFSKYHSWEDQVWILRMYNTTYNLYRSYHHIYIYIHYFSVILLLLIYYFFKYHSWEDHIYIYIHTYIHNKKNI